MNASLSSMAIALVALWNQVHVANSKVLNVQLPKPLSDHSSTFVPGTEQTSPGIYIAGGCDSPQGNTRETYDFDDWELDYFLCDSVSQDLYVLDADSMTFSSAAKMPRPRYRHAAVHALGKLWLIGGRTIPDDLVIPEIDVYDPATDKWSTVGSIWFQYKASDSAAFASPDGSKIYVVGGYNQGYYAPYAIKTTYSFDTQSALNQLLELGDNSKELVLYLEADLLQARGDIQAVTSEDGSKVYVAGGYGGACQPLTSIEVYDFATEEWSSAGNLVEARGDGAMVEISGRMVAIGGAINDPEVCEASNNHEHPTVQQSMAVGTLEALEPNGAFQPVPGIFEPRFRFSAATWPSTGVSYAFGGQTSYDESCDCFPTTSEITALDSWMLLGSGVQAPSAAKEVNDGLEGESIVVDDSSFGISPSVAMVVLNAVLSALIVILW